MEVVRNHPRRWAEPGVRDLPGICSLLICAIGVNLLVLGLTSIIAALAVSRTGARQPLFTDAPTELTYVYSIAGLLTGVSVAFLVDSAALSLVAVAAKARLTIPGRRSLREPPVSETCPVSRTSLCVTLTPPRQAEPRAPPM
jgi:hypothetical protein